MLRIVDRESIKALNTLPVYRNVPETLMQLSISISTSKDFDIRNRKNKGEDIDRKIRWIEGIKALKHGVYRNQSCL